MKLLDWIDEYTGALSALRQRAAAPVARGAVALAAWPSAILFTLVVQGITGLALWMFYSPSTLSAWESVYYVQREVTGGALLRAIHYYAGQALLVLIGLYLAHLLVCGAYRGGRRVLFWVATLLGVVTLGLLLTGDLLPWTQRGYWSTVVRTSYLRLLPLVGDWAYGLAVGGPEVGQLTLTRFFALHAGVLAVAFGLLLYAHVRLARRVAAQDPAPPAGCYWPRQALVNAVACAGVVLVLAILIVLGSQPDESGPPLGVPLEAVADTSEAYKAARPDWYLVSLYQLATWFSGAAELVPIFVIPGLLVGLLLAMPWIGRTRIGHVANLVVAALLLAAAAGLTASSWRADNADAGLQAAIAEAQTDARRAVVLIDQAGGVPPAGVLALLRDDYLTQGPKLFREHCASCHDCSGSGIVAAEPSAPTLDGFGSEAWLRGLLDPKRVGGPHYFGNTKFAKGKMVEFVKGDLRDTLKDLAADEDTETFPALLATLVAEADGRKLADKAAQKKAAAPLDACGCLECHSFYNAPKHAPDLTGWASREWIKGIIRNPADPRFYGERNDRMPAYAKTPDKPEMNVLTARQIEMLTDWLIGIRETGKR